MLQFTVSVEIKAEPERVWRYLLDIGNWWLPSNPEHESIEILDGDEPLRPGTRIRIRERIAGIPGEAIGSVTEYIPGERVTWQTDAARYRLWGVPVQVSEGVRWSVRPSGEATVLSATVWASFPGLKGRLMEWLFQGPLNGAARDRLHAQRELEFIRSELEKAGGGDGDIANDHLTPG